MSAEDRNEAGESPPILAAYKRHAGPPPGKKEENWAAIAAATGVPVADPRPATDLPHAFGPTGLTALVGLGALGLGTLGLGTLGLALGGLLIGSPWSSSEPSVAPSRAATTSPAAAVEGPAPVEAVAEVPAVTGFPERDDVAPVAEVPAPRRAAPREVESPAEPVAEAGSGLAEELAILREARGAMARSDASAALEALDRHAARYPSGTLATEREVTRISALCLAHRRADAERVASTLAPSPAIERALARCEAP